MSYIKKGYLVAFTGIDGSGKTTQANLLVQNLKREGMNVSYVWSRWEPFLLKPFIKMWKRRRTNKTGDYKEIQRDKESLLGNPFFRYLWLFSFLIDYGLQILFRLRIKLIKGGVVVSDRLFYDSLIDQAINLGHRGERLLEGLNSWWMRFLFPAPDVVIYIDCPESIAFTRNITKNDTPDIKYLIERREIYLDLADRYKWIKINGTLSIETIAKQIKGIVYKELAI